MVHDITERKQAEEALRKLNAELEERVAEQTAEIRRTCEAVEAERQRFYNVLESLPAYVVLLTPDYHVPLPTGSSGSGSARPGASAVTSTSSSGPSPAKSARPTPS